MRFVFRRSAIAGIVVVSLMLGACTLALHPGLVEGDAPPRLITLDGKAAWDNPAAFGPVPASMKTMGEEICSALNSGWRRYHATGYHSRAQMPDGTPFPRGAFYCE